ncbi:MAG: hypothetical protein M1828_005613 [Chrysothrix sp. TS-e1954]|nr:MAG: hypothetical protein M1828_005613 [Chrysothrix sp. TS-e1954]
MDATEEHGAPGSKGKTWATLISNLDYLPGLFVLSHSLARQKTNYPLLVLYTSSLPAAGHAAIDARKLPKRHIPTLQPITTRSYGTDTRFHDTWSKLAVFNLLEYERVVLLDSDMLVRRNLDELMDIPLDAPGLGGTGERVFAAAHACVCNPMRKPHYPSDWRPENCAFSDQHRDPEAAQRDAASNRRSLGMPNSGTVVLNPSRGIYERILRQLDDREAVESYAFPDQALLGDVFYGRWVSLPYVYNALKTLRMEGVHSQIWRDEEVRVVHYILSPKPWNEKEGEGGEVAAWWHEANRSRLESEKKNGIDDGI